MTIRKPGQKIQRVTITLDLVQRGNPALPNKRETVDGVVASLPGTVVSVVYGKEDPVRGRKRQDMTILAAYSKLASVEENRKAPDLSELRSKPAS